MSKKETPGSYFQKTFGKTAPEKPVKEEGDFKEKRPSGDRKKSFDKDRKPAEGRPTGKKEYNDAPRRSYGKSEGDAPRRRFDDKEGKPFERRERSDAPRSGKRDEGAPRRRSDDKEGKPFERRERSDAPRSGKRDEGAPRRRFDDKEGKPFERRERSDAPRSGKRDEGAPRRRSDDKEGKPFERRERSDAPRSGKRDEGAPHRRFDDKEGKPFKREDKGGRAASKEKQSFEPKDRKEFKKDARGARDAKDSRDTEQQREHDNQTVISRDNQVHNTKIGAHLKPRKSRFDDTEEPEEDIETTEKAPEKMPLNKYIAHCGICSRRDAVEFIKQGKVKVNGELATEPGMKIAEGDAVTVAGKKIFPQKNLTYILLNKPKGFITTTEDEKGRRTIMELVSGSEAERLYPVGRLDRNTTGLILLTNDGELSQKLSHPKYNIKKIYQVTLDKPITKPDFEQILAGVTLEDGLAPVDSLAMLEEKNELGIEIHSGKNRIVRRIFEHLGYQVEKLDRVMYAGLTKKNLPRGKWRLLTDREVILLKHFKS